MKQDVILEPTIKCSNKNKQWLNIVGAFVIKFLCAVIAVVSLLLVGMHPCDFF